MRSAREWSISFDLSEWSLFLATPARQTRTVDNAAPAADAPAPDFEYLVDDLAYRFEDTFTRDEVAQAVEAARGEIEPINRHPEFLPVLITKHVRDSLRHEAHKRGLTGRTVPELLFVCEHNSARSQMAAAFAKHYAGEHVHVRSAGKHPLGFVNPLVERAMAERGIELHKPYPKGIAHDVMHAADVIVEIGVELPSMPAKQHLRWEVADPHGESMEHIRSCRDTIDGKVKDLLAALDIPRAK